jgi:hypothetical protein
MPTIIEDHRIALVHRIHALLLHETGEDIDINLMLGPAEYARAVMSLCRASGNPELAGLADDFLHSSRAQAHQSLRPASRYAAQLAQQQ